MICRDVILKIEEKYPKEAALEWDNVGLLVGRTEKEVLNILVALDLTDEVISEAINRRADMIVTHHPVLFAPQKNITDETLIGHRILRLIQNDICCYAMHTNYDVLQMAQMSSDMLGLVDARVLEETGWNEEGIGRIGALPREMTVAECAHYVKELFGIPSVKVFGDAKKSVRIAAISPGSGKSIIKIALEKGAQVLISGDIDHHTGLDAAEEGMVVIDAGHYGLEHIFVRQMSEWLVEATELKVMRASEEFPFQTI